MSASQPSQPRAIRSLQPRFSAYPTRLPSLDRGLCTNQQPSSAQRRACSQSRCTPWARIEPRGSAPSRSMPEVPTVDAVDQRLPTGRLAVLGLQHVLVMYAGAIAVPLIIGRALQLSPQQVAMLISADLFCCGLVTVIQSWGATQWFGIRLPVMMGVTFAAVAPMV